MDGVHSLAIKIFVGRGQFFLAKRELAMRTIFSDLSMKRRLSSAARSGVGADIEFLERRQFLSVSALTLRGPFDQGDMWTYQTTNSVSPGIVGSITTTVGDTLPSNPITHQLATEVNTTVMTSTTDPTTMQTVTETVTGTSYDATVTGEIIEFGGTSTTENTAVSPPTQTLSETTTDTPAAVIFPASLTGGVVTSSFMTTKSIATTFQGSTMPIDSSETDSRTFELQSESLQPITVLGTTYNAYEIIEDDTTQNSEESTPATSTTELWIDPKVGIVQIVTTQTSGTDSGTSATESLESDNIPGGGGGGGGGTVTGLTPTITKDTVPAAVVGGAKLHGALTVALDNSGTAAEKGFTVHVYASTDTTLDTTADTLVTSVVKPTTVNAGKVATLSIPITELPASLNGSYFLIVQTVDSASNTLTAATSSTVVVSPPFVSLAELITTTLPTTLVSDTTAKGTVTVDITNNGNVPSKGVTPIDVTLSETPGLLGTTIVTSSKSYTINPGKSTKVVEQIKSTPALADGSYFIVEQTTDPFAGGTSIASSGSAITVAAPFITLVSALGPATKSGDTLTLTNNGNIPDNIIKLATSLQVSTDPAGADTVGAAVSATVGSPHILSGKTVKIHLSQWKSIISSLSPGTYYLVIHFNDGNGNSGFAVSSTGLTIA
jgi:hypothetical protein